MKASEIVSVTAMQTSTDGINPAVRVTVTCAGGAIGIASSFESFAAGGCRPAYLYDHGDQYHGYGVTEAAAVIETIIAPAILGMDAARQGETDAAIKAALDKAGFRHFVNVTNPVSLAVLKAGAAALGLPLYRHIGGRSAFTVPVGGFRTASGSKRYDPDSRGQGKPVYNLVSYGFDSFAEADYALWETANHYEKLLAKRYGILVHRGFSLDIPAGRVESDRQLLDLMAQSIETAGYDGKIGVQIDVGASAFYDPKTNVYRGLFESGEKTADQLLEYYIGLTKDYPVVMIQDPFDWRDMERHARLLNESGIEIIGEELCGSDPGRIRECIQTGCVNAVLLSVCGFETFSDVINVVRYAKNHAVDIILKNSCGEGLDVAHFAVGFRSGALYQGGIGILGNQLLSIEEDIGPRARFYGRNGLKGERFALRQTEQG